jgi:hypothetical protein
MDFLLADTTILSGMTTMAGTATIICPLDIIGHGITTIIMVIIQIITGITAVMVMEVIIHREIIDRIL